MRAKERRAFLLEIEQQEQERQEAKAENDALHAIAVSVLARFDLERHTDRFISCADGLALLANCCNLAAKWHDDDFYAVKPFLIECATDSAPECWQNDGIVYIETAVGQVSFHVFEGEDVGLPEANGRIWSGVEYQFNAGLVARAWLDGWSREQLHQAIAACDEKRAA